jgi:hypothetical protein
MSKQFKFGLMLSLTALTLIAVFYQNASTVQLPTAPTGSLYTLVAIDTDPSASRQWQFWGFSLGQAAAKALPVPTSTPFPAPPNASGGEDPIRKALLHAMFSGDASSLSANMIRFTIGADYNKTFQGTNAKGTTGMLPSTPYVNGPFTQYIAKSVARGTCDINNDPNYIGYACNINVQADGADPATSGQVVACYDPDQFNGWGDPYATDNTAFRNGTEEYNDPNPNTKHERVALREALNLIPHSRHPVVETESLSVPYFAMDSQCESGHDFEPGSGKDGDLPVDSITLPNNQKTYGAYIASVVYELNADMSHETCGPGTTTCVAEDGTSPLKVTSVEPFNGPMHYGGSYADAGITWSSQNTGFTFPGMYSLFGAMNTQISNQLGTSAPKITGFDDDQLGGVMTATDRTPGLDGSENYGGGIGTFFALLYDRDVFNSAHVDKMSYISAHPFTGDLERELAAIAGTTPIVATGTGCCDPPGSFGEYESLEQLGSAPYVYPYVSNSTYPPAQTTSATAQTVGKSPNGYFIAADKWAYVIREMIKYMNVSGWHLLNPFWGGMINLATDTSTGQIIVDTNGNPTVQYGPSFYVLQQFMKAIPAYAQILPVADDNTIAATYVDPATNKMHLSLIIYNGIFARQVPTACPSQFPCAGRPPDSFPGFAITKLSLAPLNYQFDLSQFGVDATTKATITMIQPNSQEGLGGTVSCPINTNQYMLQPADSKTLLVPQVMGALYYSGCNMNLQADSNGVLQPPSTTQFVTALGSLNGGVDFITRYGLTLDIPVSTIEFVDIPISGITALPSMIPIDDKAFTIVAPASGQAQTWAHANETTFKYWPVITPSNTTVATDSRVFPADTYNNTYTQTSTPGASLFVYMTNPTTGTGDGHLRIYGAVRPRGGKLKVQVSYYNTSPSGGATYEVNTYGEFWKGKALLFDTTIPGAGEPHGILITDDSPDSNTAFSVDMIETNDPNATVTLYQPSQTPTTNPPGQVQSATPTPTPKAATPTPTPRTTPLPTPGRGIQQ